MNQTIKKIMILIVCVFIFNTNVRAINDIQVQQEPVTSENSKATELQVPDTLSSRSVLLIVISMFDIALGIGIINYVKKNKIEE